MTNKIKNKVSIITGAGSGIGLAIARLFAEEGSQVFILDNNENSGMKAQKEITGDGGSCTYFHCDIADEKSVKTAIKRILEKTDKIDILVNNAAVSHIGNIEQTSSEDMDRLYKINVKGLYFVTREILDSLKANGGGVILNLASIASKIALADRFAYSMSKGAVLSMTLSIAKDYIDKNIRCNCICPARVHTPFVDDFIAKNYSGQEKEMFEKLSKYQPIGRMGKPEEIARLALFLCSTDSSFITGAAYDIDGGVMTLK